MMKKNRKMNQVQNNIIEHIKWKTLSGYQDYQDMLTLMTNSVTSVIEGAPEIVYSLEHNHIITAGISAKEQDLLDSSNINIINTGRGGKYTYHGPGQKIYYPILSLEKHFAKDTRKYVNFLEDWIIAVLAEYDLKCYKIADRIGIWLLDKGSEKKIAAIGIRLKKWVSYHGVAININPDLSYFSKIVPCGLKDYEVTSMEALGLKNIDMSHFEKIAKKKFFEMI